MDRIHEYGRVVAVRRFNWRLMAHVAGVLLLYLAAGLLLPLGLSLYAGDGLQFALAVAGLVTGFINGYVAWLVIPRVARI